MKIGDRVQISSYSEEYHGRFCNCIGSVGYIHGFYKNTVGIKIDGIPNMASKYGVFWFSKRSVRCINNTESEENIMSDSMELLAGYRVADVIFEGRNSPIPYAVYDDSIVEDDYVVVNTGHHGMAIARIKGFTPDADKKGIIVQHGREVVAKFDPTDFYNRKRQKQQLAQLKVSMDRKVREIQATAIYEMLAENDPELAEMLETFKKLSKAGGQEQ